MRHEDGSSRGILSGRPHPFRGVSRALRVHRLAAVACAGVLTTSAFGATVYAHARLDARLASADTTRSPDAAKSAAAGAGAAGAMRQGADASAAESSVATAPDGDSRAGTQPSKAAEDESEKPPPKPSTEASEAAPSATMTISDPLAGTPFSGVPQVGTLFETAADGSLTSHHCTGSVVASPQGDIVITAAHCVTDGTTPDTAFAFVPGYHDGAMPYGVWYVSSVVVPRQWAADGDTDHDYAFVTVHRKGSNTAIQDVVGADTLAVDQPYTAVTRVIGYPSDTNEPITCTNRTAEFSATQLEFDCAGYPGGTSGSPFLTDVDPATGLGRVVGVIGGYEAGGESADVSYSVHFDGGVTALLEQAESEP
jgi:V8-like Glu-specific endopeptidase